MTDLQKWIRYAEAYGMSGARIESLAERGEVMPADFDRCQSGGGKIRTKKVNKTQYLHICIDKSGKTHAGEVKTKGKK